MLTLLAVLFCNQHLRAINFKYFPLKKVLPSSENIPADARAQF